DKDCGNRGKHPISKLVPLGHTMATSDAATVDRWWAAYQGEPFKSQYIAD
ncbi:MAG: hypothetical protein JKY84_11665, partial [Emcibacteraceae bacterium]|nr:hypothetical protein [Emcibacteraceae bacterium]